ncbi:mechanosensitive ion channel family protein [Chitinophaga sancti]|uniref:mechanosensitive ion channel family protein n=1 Tax=Chitinophaga sancti TaxID=1004 RepID=UPI003F79E274
MKVRLTLLLLFLCHVALLHAQSPATRRPYNATKPLDSATLSKIISQQVKDSSSGKSRLHLSDTSVAVLITRLENYTLMLNEVMSILKRGLDTTEISERLPLIDSSLNVVKRDITALGSTPNVMDLYTNRVLLVQLEWRLDNWQNQLFRFYDKLVNITDTLQQLRRDTTMRDIPAEDELRDIYVGQMATLITKWRQVDSANKRNLLFLGLLQNKVAKRYLESTNLLEDMDFQLSGYSTRMFNKDFSYLWEPPLPGKKGPKFLYVLKRSVAKNIHVLQIFFMIRRPMIAFWLLAAIGFAWWVMSNIRRIRRDHVGSEAETILQQTRYVIVHPVAGTLLLVSTLSALLNIQYPILFIEITWGIAVICVSVIVKKYLPGHLFRRWFLLVLLLALYCVNNLLIQVTFTEQWGIFTGAILGVILGYYLLHSIAQTKLPLPKYAKHAVWILIIMSALSLLLVIMARVTAAKIFGAAGVVSITMSLAIVLSVEILMEAIYLHVEANKHSSTFVSFLDYQHIKARLKSILYVIATVGYLMLVARNLYVYDTLYEMVADMLVAERKIGSFAFTFGGVIVFLLIIWISSVLSQLLTFLLGYTGNNVPTRKGWGSYMLLLRLAILGAGVLLAFAASGIPLDKLAIVVGALGVGIGFGLQNIVNNLVSGIILAFEKPIEVGDTIELGTRTGVVKEIGIRSSRISAGDGSEVIVPNGELIAQQLVNWTLSSRSRRVDISVGVTYGADINKVIQVMKQCLQQHEGVMGAPEPTVLLSNFRDGAMDFQAFFWINDLGQAGSMKSAVLTSIYASLQEAGITIAHPTPQQVQINMDPMFWQQQHPPGPPINPSAP